MSTHVTRQTRRKVGLELLSLVACIGSAVFFSGVFIAAWSMRPTVVVTLLTAGGLISYWVWHRSRHPANIDPPEAEVEKNDDDAGDRWEWYWVLAFGVTLVGVVIIGLISTFLFGLLVIVLFGLGYSDVSDAGDVTSAVLAMFAVSAVAEFALVIPLSKRWNLDFEAEPEPRDASSPDPTD
jgi:hypothetical protein